MAIHHPLSSDSLAILALTARSMPGGKVSPERDGPSPLAPSGWARVARALAAAAATPADLLGREAADLERLLGGATGAAEVIGRLTARATTLAMEVERLAGRGIWLVSIVDDAYPTRLRARLGDAAPPILYGAGAAELLNAGGVAIVGARDADATALEYARDAAAAVARAGRPVVSGGARGIDAAAMNGASEAGGSVVGAIADSLERQARSTSVRSLVEEERLVLVSSYGPDVPFSVGTAMGRNRLIYCLADAAVVVSASEGEGGTWAGATEALAARWVPVYVRIDADVPSGNRTLISNRAIALEGGAERAAELPEQAAPPGRGETGEAAAGAPGVEQRTLFGGEAEPRKRQTRRAASS